MKKKPKSLQKKEKEPTSDTKAKYGEEEKLQDVQKYKEETPPITFNAHVNDAYKVEEKRMTKGTETWTRLGDVLGNKGEKPKED